MVIEHLATNDPERLEFIQNAEAFGLALAFSSAGGASGERLYPLLVKPADWIAATERSREVLSGPSPAARSILLATFAAALRTGGQPQPQMTRFLDDALRVVSRYWSEAGEPIDLFSLERFYQLGTLFDPFPPPPRLQPTWDQYLEWYEAIGDDEEVEGELIQASRSIFELVRVLREYEPRWLRRVGFPKAYEQSTTSILSQLADWVSDLELLDPDETDEDGYPIEPLAGEVAELETLGQILELLEEIEVEFGGADLVEALRYAAESRESPRRQRLARFNDYLDDRATSYAEEDWRSPSTSPSGEIEHVFVDL